MSFPKDGSSHSHAWGEYFIDNHDGLCHSMEEIIMGQSGWVMSIPRMEYHITRVGSAIPMEGIPRNQEGWCHSHGGNMR